jgi:hypothetical protein
VGDTYAYLDREILSTPHTPMQMGEWVRMQVGNPKNRFLFVYNQPGFRKQLSNQIYEMKEGVAQRIEPFASDPYHYHIRPKNKSEPDTLLITPFNSPTEIKMKITRSIGNYPAHQHHQLTHCPSITIKTYSQYSPVISIGTNKIWNMISDPLDELHVLEQIHVKDRKKHKYSFLQF